MIWRTDSSHQCIYANEAIFQFTGTNFEEFSGLQWLDLIHPGDQTRIRNNQAYCRTHHISFRNEYRVKSSDGTYRWVLDSAMPQFSSNGEFQGYLGYVIDIHQQKIQELELKLKQSQLEQQILEISEQEQRRIGQDLHDGLAQNLLAIALKAQLLAENLGESHQDERCLADEIVQQSNQAIQETRLVAKSLAPITLEKQGLRSGLSDMSHHVKESFGVNLLFEYLGDTEGLASAHAFHLYRIIQSAVSNSIRHGQATRIKVSLDFSNPQRGRLTITDNGRGFSKKNIPDSGAGLTFMEHRAKRMGGFLTLDSKPGHGSILTCEFFQQALTDTGMNI